MMEVFQGSCSIFFFGVLWFVVSPVVTDREFLVVQQSERPISMAISKIFQSSCLIYDL